MDNPLYSMFLFGVIMIALTVQLIIAGLIIRRGKSAWLTDMQKEKWLTCRIIAGYSATSSYCWDLSRRYAHIWL